MTEDKRLTLIPELRDRIVSGLTGQATIFQLGRKEVSNAVKMWEAGDEPHTTFERAVFAVCQSVSDDVEGRN